MTPNVIGLTGKKGVGKDATAEIFAEHGDYKKLAFAEPLKRVCAIVFGLTEEEMTDRTLKEKPLDRWPFLSPRKIMQIVGTEMFRKHFPGVWVRAFEREAVKWPRVIATDVRFPDEGDSVRGFGGKLGRVTSTRPGFVSEDTHASETLQDTLIADFEIKNDGDKEHLAAVVIEKLRELN